MNYFYLQWNHKRPSVCVFTDKKPNKINIIHEVNIRGHKNIFEKIILCGDISPEFDLYIKEPIYRNRSYLLSHLQKCIRRMKYKKSIQTAKHLLDLDPNYLLRRIPILMFEDVIPHESLSVIVWLMIATSKGFELRNIMIEWILGVIYFLASCSEIDQCKKIDTINETIFKNDYGQINNTFLRSCILRLSYGGMKGDMKMIKYFINLWSERFREEDKINDSKIKLIKRSLVKLNRNEFELCANDFHCNHNLIPEIKKQYELYSEDYIKELIWNYSSRINKRINHERNEDEYKDWLIIKKYVKWLQMDINI